MAEFVTENGTHGRKMMDFRKIAVLLLLNGSVQACLSYKPSPAIDSNQNQTSFDWVKVQILNQALDAKRFQNHGPFGFHIEENFSIRLDHETLIVTDLLTPKHFTNPPLIILQHGNKAAKEMHRLQAEHLASWGFQVLATSLPNQGHWLQNGMLLSNLAHLLKNWPKMLRPDSSNIDQIIVMGHSFGGSAASIAAGASAPIDGIILLDPALYSKHVIPYLQNVKIPVVILAADQRVFYSRRRNDFFRNLNQSVEVAFRGATHDDAQFPTSRELNYLFDPYTSLEKQKIFLASMVISAFSMTLGKSNQLAWKYFETMKDNGEDILSLRRKIGNPAKASNRSKIGRHEDTTISLESLSNL